MSTNISLLETERALCSVLLTEPRTIIPTWGVLKPGDISDPLCSRIYQACLDLAHASKVPNPYTVSALLPDVALETLLDIQRRANAQLVAEVLALADVIRQEAAYRRVIAITADISGDAAKRPHDLEGFCYNAMQQLSIAMEGREERSSDLTAIGAEVDAELAEGVITGIPTGFQWLTDRIGGFRPGHIISIVAAFKMRKSSTMRHMLLAAARAHKHVGAYILEGSRTDLYMDLWSMLATERLQRLLAPEQFELEAHLDSTHLRTALRTPTQHQALLYARQELDDLAPYLHLCDGRDGIATLNNFIVRVLRDRFLHHLDIFFLDHLQLMDTTAHDPQFKNIESTVGAVQHLATTEGITAVILSQRRSASIGDEESHDPGAKGGGALVAACDHIITTYYDGEKAPDLLTLRLKLSRRAQPGKKVYVINAASGLILGEAATQEGI
jgi:replicative DNA helicase